MLSYCSLPTNGVHWIEHYSHRILNEDQCWSQHWTATASCPALSLKHYCFIRFHVLFRGVSQLPCLLKSPVYSHVWKLSWSSRLWTMIGYNTRGSVLLFIQRNNSFFIHQFWCISRWSAWAFPRCYLSLSVENNKHLVLSSGSTVCPLVNWLLQGVVGSTVLIVHYF